MLAAVFATLLFAASVVFASRTTAILGSLKANLLRLLLAGALLAIWGHGWGAGLGGGGFAWFFISGCVGFGVGDLALYQALPRVGPRLAGLLIQCLAAPFAVLAEWLWMGVLPRGDQVMWAGVILVGVSLAVAPSGRLKSGRGLLWVGVSLGVLAAAGQGLGAVISRKAYEVVAATGGQIDGLSAAYQRMLGGLTLGAPCTLLLLARERSSSRDAVSRSTRGEAAKRGVRAWPWVLLNVLAGPTLGVGFYQLALSTTPSGVVLPIVATMPVVVMPLTYYLDGDRPSRRAIIGGLLAVAAAAALAAGG